MPDTKATESALARWRREVLAPRLKKVPERQTGSPRLSGRPIEVLYNA
jgi:hypothetical protein